MIPRVTVAIPTFNRATALAKAVASVQAQDCESLEILVGDNASSDDTRDLCADLARREPRLRYRRHAVNRGPIANFRSLFEEARGEFFMWLADDDRLGPGHLRECVSSLTRQPGHSAVAGRTLYCSGEMPGEQGQNLSLESEDPRSRVLEHYARVVRNELFHSLMRREAVAACPLREAVGADWHFVAALVFAGKVRTLESVHLERALGGTSDNFERIIKVSGLPAWHARVPYLVMAANAFAEIAWRTRSYRRLGAPGRLRLAARAAFSLAWRGRSHDFQALSRARTSLLGRLTGRHRVSS